MRAVALRQPDLIVLDVMLEEESGLEVLDRIRASGGTSARIDPDLPVLILSGRGSEGERVRGFARGADDYLVKPFAYPELVARVRAWLRAADARRKRGPIRVGDLVVDPSTRDVRLGDQRLTLSAKEFALLHALASEPTRVVPKAELLRDVWGDRR